MTEENQFKIKKVLFYTSTPRVFRTTLIGYLYEITQHYKTILLSEELDSETEEILRKKELFPKLEKIIPVYKFIKKKANLFIYNKEIHTFLGNTICQYKPEIIISSGDMHSLFEMYLMRLGKRIEALKIAFQLSNIGESVTEAKCVDLVNAYLRFPRLLPLPLRLFLVKCRKYFGHYVYYWILPLLVGEKPFFGRSSYILRHGKSGMRDTNYQTAFSKRDYDIYLKEGVPAEKLYILPHPLVKNKEFFERAYLNKFKKYKENVKIASLMLPGEIEFGFKKDDYSLISPEERGKNWIESIKLIPQILSGWKIYIKPHPDTKNFGQLKKSLELISKNIKVVNPQELADKYIEIADLIIGLPLSASTALFTASLQCPEKPIISLDFHHELLGDYYKDFEGIEYIDNKDRFVKTLKLICDNEYHKKVRAKLEPQEFSSAVELLEYLLNKKKQ